jgi:large subunit ribosomal protein L29
MKMSELREKTAVELAALERDLRLELFNLRLQQASSQLEKPARLRVLRRDVARVQTQLAALRKKPA